MGRSLTGPGNIAKLGDTMLGSFNEAKGPDIPSSTSVNLVISKGNLVDITGTNDIISMNLPSGAERVLRFTSSLRIIHSATLVLIGGEDIITTPGDFAIVRGYPNGVVRFVTYSRASGYVQKIGDTLQGTLTYAAGTNSVPPVKYKAGSLTTLTVPHACEWNGTNLFMTTGAGVRKQVLYVDGDGSKLTGLTSTQITDALGYVPYSSNLNETVISPAGATMEVGRYIDFHYANDANDYDARIECESPFGGFGSSAFNIKATKLKVNGFEVWTQANLGNVSQLTNDMGYISSTGGGFSGQTKFGSGSSISPSICFSADPSYDTGLYRAGAGILGITVGSTGVVTYSSEGMTAVSRYGQNAGITLEKSAGSYSLSGDLRIDTDGGRIRFYDTGGAMNGAYIDVSSCGGYVGTEIVTGASFQSLLSSFGYQKIPGGMIIQWGMAYNIGIGHQQVNFPTTFPNQCVGLFTSYDDTTDRGSYRSGGSATNSGAMIPTDNCNTWWFAIGY